MPPSFDGGVFILKRRLKMKVSSISIDYDENSTPAIDESLLNWMLEQVGDVLIPENILDELINPALINSMNELENYLKRTFCEPWGIDLSLKYDSNVASNEVLIGIRGPHPRIRFVASALSQYLIKNSLNQLGITSVTDSNNCIKIELSNSHKTRGGAFRVKPSFV